MTDVLSDALRPTIARLLQPEKFSDKANCRIPAAREAQSGKRSN
jgi:hypothetical protein